MTRISQFKVDDDVLEKIFSLFFEVVSKGKNEVEFQNIIHDLLSPAERIMIAKRVAIFYMLMKKLDYYNIAKSLKVSPSTIAKFNLVKENSRGIVSALKGTVRNEKIINFFEELILELRRPGKYGINWKDAWQEKIDHERKKEKGI
ncbi:hypothetical protein CO165_02125 [Candidatus Roizmanbacteria bacterium CG_4_9_14_3_um_filter_33_18]|uniref:TrpR like protein, YerC/YecD n=3 Tax=Candidatus Roizmaniibacteriota TaxID=1752723 RepID=A0A2M7UB36_9BACT|nr:MAG: hypothetical protein COW97_03110 [Candidatus Roizmanbacteria bacterium CG22_combo_CG10-13_8_21_14_all_34_12]PIZ68431.1 MAG: hypothetical protein COY12_00190 [Candidatus Roizmanbacteria bacterium CG_4_10_14_0_2_um_filter_33_96]PJA55709.1 MAG: hypothetical protein CO165_02125 [Candidatus Roizmanbacteria bacterium CG_4_9_14_3_um_filter_33_18]